MITSKALYWIALAVFTFGLSTEYHQGRFPALHSAASRAEDALCRVTAHAQHTLALAGILTGHPRQELRIPEALSDEQQARVEALVAQHQAQLNRAMALRQAELDRAMAKLDRVHMVMDRVQAEKIRLVERSRVKVRDAANRRIVICPRTGSKIMVDEQPEMADIDLADSD